MPTVIHGHTLLLIRHSSVRMQQQKPANEWSLSIEGREQCRQFAPLLSRYQPALIVTSTENKAKETGLLLADVLNASVVTDQNLNEHDRQGVPYIADQKAFYSTISQFFANPDQLVFGRETAAQACRRIDSAVTALLNQYAGSNLAIVTHGAVLTLFISHHNPLLDPMTLWSSLKMPCAVLLRLPSLAFKELILPSTI